jgi:hypothetical protein
MGQGMSRATQNYIGARALPHLESIPPRTKLIYTMKSQYAGYPFSGHLKAQGKTLDGRIKYIEKSDVSKGFGTFFDALVKDAKVTECEEIRVEFDQCSEAMQRKLLKYSEKYGFEFDKVPEDFFDPEPVATAGPNIVVSKKI